MKARESGPCRLIFEYLVLVGTVWEGLEGVTLLEGMCHKGGI